ncbi:GNAT family N-acetyltransferase [Streptomyces anulatus]|uniref:GNAT family N-acetyltransferase n=1 Tax=Streptomyces anulatus TaxID=1892 RepID=UPI0022558A63|nr:GNAT family N-acetyltransferase [Streptomyces anulatus]
MLDETPTIRPDDVCSATRNRSRPAPNRLGIASALLAKAQAVHRDERAFFAYGQFTAGDAALARFYRRHGFTVHAPGEPVILPGSSRHRDVGASPLLGEQMFSRPI